MRLICSCCGAGFEVDKRARKYCSHKCSSDARIGTSIASKGKARPHTRRAAVRPCPVCRVEFRATKDFGQRKQKFCSRDCWQAARAVIPRPCGACGETFKPAWRDAKFCSKACVGADYALRMKGENSHFWRGGRTEAAKILRSSAAYAAWRTAVFERDGYRCVECGANGVLEADHIEPLSERPDLALDVNNGRTLCVPCHRATETWGWKQMHRLRAAA